MTNEPPTDLYLFQGWTYFVVFLLVGANTDVARYNPSAGPEQKVLSASPRAAG